MEDVALPQYGHTSQHQKRSRKFRGKKLQWQSDLVVNDGWNRNHQEQNRPGKKDGPKEAPTREKYDESREQENKRRTGQEQFRPQASDNQGKQSAGNNREPEPGRLQAETGQSAAALPDNKCCKNRNEEAMREIRIGGPLPD